MHARCFKRHLKYIHCVKRFLLLLSPLFVFAIVCTDMVYDGYPYDEFVTIICDF